MKVGAQTVFAPLVQTLLFMMVFSLTTMRSFSPYDLKPYAQILAYLRRIGAREAYRRAMQKGDPGMTLLLD